MPVESPGPVSAAPAGVEREGSLADPAQVGNAHPLRLATWLFFAALGLWLLGYLAVAVPASWFPAAAPKEWAARELTVARGAGSLVDNELIVTAVDTAGLAIVSLNTDFRSADYRAIAWLVADVPESAEVSLLWRSDYQPAKLNAVRLTSAYGRLLPEVLARDPNWTGRISGLALSIKGSLAQPVRVRGVVAKPMGALELLRDRAAEWRAFEAWTGTSINTLAGGADVQDLPLPALFAATIAAAALAWYAVAQRRRVAASLPAAIAVLFVIGWLVLDARWTANLARQVRATATQYAGKDWRERRLAAEDGPLFAFIEKVRAKLPAKPERVFMVADAHYFRGRGAYHLYPHNVHFEPYQNVMPPASALRAGDYLVVYQRRGVRFNPAERKLQWDDGPPVDAEVLLVEPGAALFRIR